MDRYLLNGWGYFSLALIDFQLAYEHLFKILTFSSSVVFVCWCSFVTIFKCSNLQFHYTFAKAHQISSELFLFSTIDLAYVLEIDIFGRNYLNLYNLFQRY